MNRYDEAAFNAAAGEDGNVSVEKWAELIASAAAVPVGEAASTAPEGEGANASRQCLCEVFPRWARRKYMQIILYLP